MSAVRKLFNVLTNMKDMLHFFTHRILTAFATTAALLSFTCTSPLAAETDTDKTPAGGIQKSDSAGNTAAHEQQPEQQHERQQHISEFSVLHQYAQIASDTYLPDNELAAQLENQQQTLIHQSLIADHQVSYFLAEANGIQTIVIRGTANLTNVMVDLSVNLEADEALGITLHKGFRSAASAVYQDVKPYLKTDKPLIITGHSLGGAIAVVLAMYCQQDGHPASRVITFGQPKVTNVTGANTYADIPLTRVVTEKDLVPLVPPLSPLQIKNMDIYWHIGSEIILLNDQQYSQTQGLKSMLRATKSMTAIPGEENLNAHKISTYIDQLSNLRNQAEEIPYQTNINLFGFSLD